MRLKLNVYTVWEKKLSQTWVVWVIFGTNRFELRLGLQLTKLVSSGNFLFTMLARQLFLHVTCLQSILGTFSFDDGAIINQNVMEGLARGSENKKINLNQARVSQHVVANKSFRVLNCDLKCRSSIIQKSNPSHLTSSHVGWGPGFESFFDFLPQSGDNQLRSRPFD